MVSWYNLSMNRHIFYKYHNISQNDRKQIFLPPDEYSMVMSAFNTDLTDEERMRRIISKPIGDYVYTIINNGYNEYIVIGKSPIESIDEDWEDGL